MRTRTSPRPLPALLLLVAAGLFAVLGTAALGQSPYQRPPDPIPGLLDAPPTPSVSLSPARDRMILAQGTNYPTIDELAAPMLRLAGQRLNPRNNGPHRPPRVIGLTLKNLDDGAETPIRVPDDPSLGSLSWAPDGKSFAFTNTTPDRIELWVGDAETGAARRLSGVQLNAAFGFTYQWLPDSETLLCQTIPAGRGAPPAPPAVPAGPVIQETHGDAAPVRTYQDLLQNPHDEDLFEYYSTSQLALVNASSGRATPLGEPAIFGAASVAPDGEHLLLVRVTRPFSYLVPAFRFPQEVEVWNRSGEVVHRVASHPLAERVPIGGVITGPRSLWWRPTEPATLVWVEALDEGDPRNEVPHRDQLLSLKPPFTGEPLTLARLEHRYSSLAWGAEFALVSEFDRDRRWRRTFLIDPDDPAREPRLIWDLSSQDRYNDPGSPVMRPLPDGGSVIWQDGDSIFLSGAGASPEGDRPFLDRFNLTTREAERLFHCDDQSYETVVALLAEDGSRFLTRYETPEVQPNYYLREAGRMLRRQVTEFPAPPDFFRRVNREIVTYEREDGVPLSFTLYTPPDYRPGTPMPTVIWAYPREYGDPTTAGQISGSSNRFTTVRGASHMFFLTQGYVVLDGAAMPVIGDAETMNDTYVEQIVSSAKAAIDKAVELGVTDRARVGVGGHSYGGFMTANLLAHSDLFAAGIARSGAYNRTLTPFGFQSERRTFWEARDTYMRMSPFTYADQIETPVLLIHGEVDNNSGTFPIQSERLYHAISGNGGTARYVVLPHESHGYAARESIEHALYEMIAWFDRWVKNSPAR